MEGTKAQEELVAFHQHMEGEKKQVEEVVEQYNELVLEMVKAVGGQCSEQVAEAARVVVEHYNEPVQEMAKVECRKQVVVERYTYLVVDMMNKVVEEGCSGQGAEMTKVVVERCSKLVEEEVGVKVMVGGNQCVEEGVGVKGWDTLHMGEEEAGAKGWDILHMGEAEKELGKLEVGENAYSVELGEEVGNARGEVGILDSRQEMEVVGILDSRQGMAEVGMEVVAAVYSEQVGMEVGDIEKVDSRREVGRVVEEEGVVVEVQEMVMGVVVMEVEEMVMGVVVTVVEEMVMGVGARVVEVEVVMVMGVVVTEEEEEEEEEMAMVEGGLIAMVAEEGG